MANKNFLPIKGKALLRGMVTGIALLTTACQTPPSPSSANSDLEKPRTSVCEDFKVGEALNLRKIAAEAHPKGMLLLPLILNNGQPHLKRSFEETDPRDVRSFRFSIPRDRVSGSVDVEHGIITRINCGNDPASLETDEQMKIPLDKSIDTPNERFKPGDMIKGPTD